MSQMNPKEVFHNTACILSSITLHSRSLPLKKSEIFLRLASDSVFKEVMILFKRLLVLFSSVSGSILELGLKDSCRLLVYPESLVSFQHFTRPGAGYHSIRIIHNIRPYLLVSSDSLPVCQLCTSKQS